PRPHHGHSRRLHRGFRVSRDTGSGDSGSHDGSLPVKLWSEWEFDPGVVIPVALSAILYLRGARLSRGATRFQQLLFWTGWATLVIALISPLAPLGDSLFS